MRKCTAMHGAWPPCLIWPWLSLFTGFDVVAPISSPSGITVTVRLLTHDRNKNKANRSQEFEKALLQHLLQLGVSDYEALLARLLQAVGYQQVRVLRDSKRARRSHKGRTAHGGIDIIAWSRSGMASDRVLVQVKQYERFVSRRFVDELRGALLRTQSRHALLITTSRFAPAAVRAAQEDHIAPIHLINGERLCRLLIRHQIGVRRDWRGSPQVDHNFFNRLQAAAINGSAANTTAPKPDAQSQVQVRKNNRPAHPRQAKKPGIAGTPLSISTTTITEKGGEMMGRTHALIGLSTLWLFQWSGTLNAETLAPLIVLALGGVLAPDLDAQDSILKRFAIAGLRPFVPLSQLLHQAFGHRGLLHSLLGLGFFTLLCGVPLAVWLGWPSGAVVTLGYASHLLADSATKSGIPLLYPRRRRYHLLPRALRLTTGSAAEDAVFAVAASIVLWLLLQQLPKAATFSSI